MKDIKIPKETKTKKGGHIHKLKPPFPVNDEFNEKFNSEFKDCFNQIFVNNFMKVLK